MVFCWRRRHNSDEARRSRSPLHRPGTLSKKLQRKSDRAKWQLLSPVATASPSLRISTSMLIKPRASNKSYKGPELILRFRSRVGFQKSRARAANKGPGGTIMIAWSAYSQRIKTEAHHCLSACCHVPYFRMYTYRNMNRESDREREGEVLSETETMAHDKSYSTHKSPVTMSLPCSILKHCSTAPCDGPLR